MRRNDQYELIELVLAYYKPIPSYLIYRLISLILYKYEWPNFPLIAE